MRFLQAAGTTAYLCAMLSSIAAVSLTGRSSQRVICERAFSQCLCGPDTDLTNKVCVSKCSCNLQGAFKCVSFGACTGTDVQDHCENIGNCECQPD
ncbi:hypothetical protein B0A55_06384 [Friedmanniomyces simplex]|uniref:Extracellular membrane protein CFEM domain-containing protein n=1 Tax=Friedmanniomyces simplex TaxID=329884 RepID=A0A4U0XN27_9PEZI|nr:hypothetical protein B0A55_06384 [Friedmanniomyces simplex]